MHYKNLLAAIIVILALPLQIAQAKQVAAVFDFDAVGIDQQTAEAATQIFRSDLGAEGKYMVLNRGDIEKRLEDAGIYDYSAYDINGASEKARAADAEVAVIGSITKLGNKIIAEVQRIDVGKGEVDFSDRFSTDSIEDLDVVMKRLARAVATGNKVESEANKFALTGEETEESRHRKSYITSGLSFGFGFPIGDSSYSNANDLKALAWNMRYEAGNYVVENSLGITWGSAKYRDDITGDTRHKGIFVIPWDIGLRYVLSPSSDISPYFGGGIGLHFIFAAEIDNTPIARADQAMALNLATGIYAFQSYDFRFTFDVKYTIVFSDAFYGSKDTSQQIGIYVGIARKWTSGRKKILLIF